MDGWILSYSYSGGGGVPASGQICGTFHATHHAALEERQEGDSVRDSTCRPSVHQPPCSAGPARAPLVESCRALSRTSLPPLATCEKAHCLCRTGRTVPGLGPLVTPEGRAPVESEGPVQSLRVFKVGSLASHSASVGWPSALWIQVLGHRSRYSQVTGRPPLASLKAPPSATRSSMDPSSSLPLKASAGGS